MAHRPEADSESSGDSGGDRLWKWAQRVPLLGLLVTRRERSVVRDECARMLGLIRKVQVGEPTLEGEALYARTLVIGVPCDENRAREIIRLADQSFAQWPEERDVKFRDVVNYVIVNQIVSAHAGAIGTRAEVVKHVHGLIPEDL